MSSSANGPSTDDLRAWLTQRVAHYLERPVEGVDPATSLIDYGLDSVFAVSLCGDIEDHYQVTLDPTVAWDYPSVDLLTEHLLTEHQLAPSQLLRAEP